MLNFDQILPLAANAAGDQPILTAPYPLPSVICRILVSNGVINGYLAESNCKVEKYDPLVAGWWINCGDVWFLRRRMSRTILLLSGQAEEEISNRMLLEAHWKGFERILLVGPDGSITREVNVSSLLSHRLCGSSTATHTPTYEQAFEDLYTLLGARLRFPAQDFDPERVLIIAGTLQAGGAERQATTTACGLAKQRPGKVHVAYNSSDESLDFYRPILDAANVLSHPISYVTDGNPTYSLPDIMDIRNKLAARYACLGFLNAFYVIFHQALLMQTIKPGIVHCFQDYSNVLAGIAADLAGVPRIVLNGRSLAPEHFGIFQPYMAPGYHALLKRRTVTFLNNSEAGATDYSRWLGIPRDYFRVINNGFEFPTLQRQLGRLQRQALGVPEDAVLIGSIIGFREEKRPELFIEMARVLQASHPNTHFAIFGSGALLRACQRLVETQRLSGTIHLPGLTRNAWAALSAMDVFVLPSRLEGLPNVLIEAQAMGVPVICSGAGGMAETFVEGETGFAVPSASAEALAASVGRLIDDKELRSRMSAAAEKHAPEKFSIDRMIGLTIKAYADTPPATSISV